MTYIYIYMHIIHICISMYIFFIFRYCMEQVQFLCRAIRSRQGIRSPVFNLGHGKPGLPWTPKVRVPKCFGCDSGWGQEDWHPQSYVPFKHQTISGYATGRDDQWVWPLDLPHRLWKGHPKRWNYKGNSQVALHQSTGFFPTRRVWLHCISKILQAVSVWCWWKHSFTTGNHRIQWWG